MPAGMSTGVDVGGMGEVSTGGVNVNGMELGGGASGGGNAAVVVPAAQSGMTAMGSLQASRLA
ncbi:hypothetical protein KEM55_006135 [Ascosphaera atra]|nr:hypothetical protein KEM55_006135 [Ascosphaera atra]